MIARILIAVVIAGGIAAWMWTGTVVVSGAAEEATPRPPAERSEADSALFRVRAREIVAQDRQQTLTMRGKTRADGLVSVAAETAGRVSERPIDRGDVVNAGDVLCRIDTGTREAELAKARAEVAKAQLEFDAATQLQGRGFESATRVASTRAALDAAQASVAAAQQELERTIVRSPIAGMVEDPITDVGSVLAVGGLCATVVDRNPIIVTGQVTERDVAKVGTGLKADVRLITGEYAQGIVSFVSSTADEETRTFTVEIRIDNPGELLRAGVTAVAEIPLEPVRVHRLSPGVLTLNDEGAVGVRIVGEDGIVSFMPVSIAMQDTKGFWVEGLPLKVRVITVGQEYVIEGQKVEPVLEPANLGDEA
ncbi:MAG: efflux RND transporter periplasmic adaptor subunit [Pseudomonadota bacterium]